MKSFEEKVIESIMGQLNVSESEAKSMARGLIRGDIPYIDTGVGRIVVK